MAAQQQQQTANVSEDQQDAATSYDRAFVAIRPPGHVSSLSPLLPKIRTLTYTRVSQHCGEANPQGFCFVNNVAVAAAHGSSSLGPRPCFLAPHYLASIRMISQLGTVG